MSKETISRNDFCCVVVPWIMEHFFGDLSRFNRLLNAREDGADFIQQVANGVANFCEAVASPPVGLVRVQTTSSALLEDVAVGTRPVHDHRPVDTLWIEIVFRDVGERSEFWSNRTSRDESTSGHVERLFGGGGRI